MLKLTYEGWYVAQWSMAENLSSKYKSLGLIPNSV